METRIGITAESNKLSSLKKKFPLPRKTGEKGGVGEAGFVFERASRCHLPGPCRIREKNAPRNNANRRLQEEFFCLKKRGGRLGPGAPRFRGQTIILTAR